MRRYYIIDQNKNEHGYYQFNIGSVNDKGRISKILPEIMTGSDITDKEFNSKIELKLIEDYNYLLFSMPKLDKEGKVLLPISLALMGLGLFSVPLLVTFGWTISLGNYLGAFASGFFGIIFAVIELAGLIILSSAAGCFAQIKDGKIKLDKVKMEILNKLNEDKSREFDEKKISFDFMRIGLN